MGYSKNQELTNEKISRANKGRKPSLLAIENSVKAGKGKKLSEEHKKKMSEAFSRIPKEKRYTPEIAAKISATHKARGIKPDPELGKATQFKKTGDGVTPIDKIIRCSSVYKKWRTDVFKRDDYTCQTCGERGGVLRADHIKPFAFFPELRFELSNGRTLCDPCHRKTDTYGTKAFKFREFQIA